MNPEHGGVVEAVSSMAKRFNSTDLTTDVLCFDENDDKWLLQNDDFKVYGLGKRHTGYGINLVYFSWLVRNARSYDVVILDGLWQFHILGGYVLKLLGVPYCVFTHGMLDPYFNENKLKYLKKLPFWFLVERNVISLANAVIFTCEDESQLAAISFPYFAAKPRIATLGVQANSTDDAILKSAFYSTFPDLVNKRFVLFLSRIHPKKGIDLLIDAVAKVTSLPSDTVFVIAGPDQTDETSKLQRRAKELGVESRFKWVGMLTGNIKWGAYVTAESFILPSHQENFGIVVAEALSAGTPVLITNKVNIWREIAAAGAGLVENDNVEGITKLLNQWFTLTAEEKRDMADKAKNCYQNNFSIESAVTDLESVLLDVINTANANES
jgi:glycosyltransferase involved in cell wall biosynthesis